LKVLPGRSCLGTRGFTHTPSRLVPWADTGGPGGGGGGVGGQWQWQGCTGQPLFSGKQALGSKAAPPLQEEPPKPAAPKRKADRSGCGSMRCALVPSLRAAHPSPCL
jgi:hypothetical protein